MHSRLIPALVALLLALTLTGASATAADPEVSGPRLPEQASDTARERAEVALARAQSLFQERSPAAARQEAVHGGRDATMVLNELLRARDDLSPADRERADRLLARPTDGQADRYDDGYEVEEEPPVCGDAVCIHYVATTNDAPPARDADPRNDIPDEVDRALATAEQVHQKYVGAGYLPPDPDAGRGGNNKIDIYLADVGALNPPLYGYCTSDQPQKRNNTWNYWAYCVIDNDFHPEQFPTNTPAENQQVTLAHEYFHAIQYAYDAYEDGWFMEATATWAEDELYDDVNDNRYYLRFGQLMRTQTPLDEYGWGLNMYGNWIFFRYLTERWPEEEPGALPRLVREVWEQASGRANAPDMYSTQAIQSVLAARDTSFTAVYGQFAAANRHPARTYEEGAAYPRPPVDRRFTLRRGNRRVGPLTLRLDHLTHRAIRYRPGKGIRAPDWRLRIAVNMPPRRTAPVARLVITRSNGRVAHKVIRLNRKGVGNRTVGFSSRRVKTVDLLLVNASRRTECPPKGYTYSEYADYACFGVPTDDKLRSAFRARSFRS